MHRRRGRSTCPFADPKELGFVERAYGVHPVDELVTAGADMVVNLSASPFTLPKKAGRERMFSAVAARAGKPFVFVNQVGGNDDLVFDGASAVFGPDGSVWSRAAVFDEDFVVCDLASPQPMERSAPANDEATLLEALVLGTRDYAGKCGFRSGVLGLSGGVDSALTACIAARAIGPQNVHGVALPTRYSSDGSLRDAEALATALGMQYSVVPIDGIFQSYLDSLGPRLEALKPASADDVTLENIQSRVRCAVLMAISNRTGALVLTTGNKSEIAVGYCTLYGDMAGGLAVIGDLPKTQVYRLAREVNRQASRDVIPESTLTKAPSAELRPDQTDQDTLPPYDVLDAILERYVEDGQSIEAIVAQGFEEATVRSVVRKIAASEYKRRQMAPGLIVTRKAFGVGRRYPIAQKFRE